MKLLIHCIKYFGTWTSGQVCVIKPIDLVKMDFVAELTKLKSTPGWGTLSPRPPKRGVAPASHRG